MEGCPNTMYVTMYVTFCVLINMCIFCNVVNEDVR